MHSGYTAADLAEIRSQQSAYKLVEKLRADIIAGLRSVAAQGLDTPAEAAGALADFLAGASGRPR